ncbi:MAG: 30S ribosomal protein S3, partial [Candidatus Omnitrophota bacterium]
MGQKVHPTSFRIGSMRDWNSRWYAPKTDFAKMVLEDAKIRKIIEKDMATAFISHIDIERATKRVRVK